jgi:hypothetical protein
MFMIVVMIMRVMVIMWVAMLMFLGGLAATTGCAHFSSPFPPDSIHVAAAGRYPYSLS